jgi:fructoselysine 6-kinase
MPAPRIVAIGDNCVDVYPALGLVFPGGGAVNFAVHAARLGADAGYVGVVGDDRHGSLLRDALAAEGVDISFVRVVPGPTAVSYVRLEDGERSFDRADPGVRDQFQMEPEIEQYLLAADHVHTTLDSRVDDAVTRWSAAGRRISFDFSHRARPGQLALLPFVDIAFFSGQAISPADAEAAARAFHAQGARLVVLTLNRHGSLAFDGTTVWRQPSQPVRPVDTLGAGDGFMAGFVGRFLEDGDVPASLAAGAQASAAVCQHHGAFGWGAAMPEMPPESAGDYGNVGASERPTATWQP